MGLLPPVDANDANEPVDFSFSMAYDSLLPAFPSSPTPLPSTSWQGPTQSAVQSFPEAPAPCPVLELQTSRYRSSGEASNRGQESLITTSSGLPSPAGLTSPSVGKPDAPHIGGTAKDGSQKLETATVDTSGLSVEDARPSPIEGTSSVSGSGSQDLGQKADPPTASTVLDSPASHGREEARTEDASTGQRVDEESRQASDTKPVAGMKAPPERKKVPFEKGFSQMDWLRLTQTHPDLAGLKGGPKRRIKMEEVKLHKAEDDSWTVLRGKVFNITPYFNFHPGGKKMLKLAAGKDCTELFNKYHMWVNSDFLLEKCWLGILDSE